MERFLCYDKTKNFDEAMIEKMLISKSIDHKKILTTDISYLTYNAAKHKRKVDILNQSEKPLEWSL